MRYLFCGMLIGAFTASASAQAPGQGNFNNAGAVPPGQGAFNNSGVAPGQGGAGPQAGPGARMAPPPNAMFNIIDADGDGAITKAELRKAVAALRKLDTDDDGKITLAEASPMGRSQPGGPVGGAPGNASAFVDQMMQGDLNGDGRLAANELQGPAAQRMLQNGDQNQDGALDRNEIAAALEAMQNQFGPGATGPNPGGRRPGAYQGGFRGGAGGNFDAQQMTGRMMQFDENGDGKLSPNEVPREAKRFLNNADQDGDGLLSPSELQAVNERMGEQMRGAQGRGLRGRAVQNGAERGVP